MAYFIWILARDLTPSLAPGDIIVPEDRVARTLKHLEKACGFDFITGKMGLPDPNQPLDQTQPDS